MLSFLWRLWMYYSVENRGSKEDCNRGDDQFYHLHRGQVGTGVSQNQGIMDVHV